LQDFSTIHPLPPTTHLIFTITPSTYPSINPALSPILFPIHLLDKTILQHSLVIHPPIHPHTHVPSPPFAFKR
jgi:hypothetical protein